MLQELAANDSSKNSPKIAIFNVANKIVDKNCKLLRHNI